MELDKKCGVGMKYLSHMASSQSKRTCNNNNNNDNNNITNKEKAQVL